MHSKLGVSFQKLGKIIKKVEKIKPSISKFLKKDYSLVLPQKTAKELVNIFSEKQGELKIYFSPNQSFLNLIFKSQLPEAREDGRPATSR